MKADAGVAVLNPPGISFDHKRDAYGFAVRPQHLQRYREYANIYKEEEEERSERWKHFLHRQALSVQFPVDVISTDDHGDKLGTKTDQENVEGQNYDELNDVVIARHDSNSHSENVKEREELPPEIIKKPHGIQTWTDIRPSLCSIADMMTFRVKKKAPSLKNNHDVGEGKNLAPVEEARQAKGASEEDSEEEFYDMDRSESDAAQVVPLVDDVNGLVAAPNGVSALPESFHLWKEELDCLVQGGVPMALRGELWQAFVGVKTRRIDGYYQHLLASNIDSGGNSENAKIDSDDNTNEPILDSVIVPEKWKGQIEKDLPRTFPGHPALDDEGRNALRRLLTAYARHNPSVGYCQAMNFFAGLLLLLMPEENAFWTLMGILDDYFDGYYSEEMIESQVDQLVLEELVRERFPKLVHHLDYLGVQVAWVTGPWFLSIFMNMLPWESVLRVWDVLLFEGNRVMLFRTALAILELYGPALVTTKDAGDAVTLLQSLAGSTFDSSQLVLTACMGYPNVNEPRLQELRDKHRPAVKAAVEERCKGFQAWKDSKGLASKLYNFKKDTESINRGANPENGAQKHPNGEILGVADASADVNQLYIGLTENVEIDSVPDLKEQVVWLKVELCKLLEEKRSAELRSEELETALMEMVKQDNRRQLSAKVEQLEQEVADLRRVLSDKQEQENAMLQVLIRVEQEQKLTEDARRFAEQDASAQRYALQELQEKYEQALAAWAEMEKRAVMAESMVEATLQYQSGQTKTLSSPRSMQQVPSQESTTRKIGLLSRPFGLGWRDRNKGNLTTVEESSDEKTAKEPQNASAEHKEINGHQVNDNL